MFEEYPTKQDATRTATEYAEPLDRLISPSDVDENADTWSDIDRDRVESEIWESVMLMRSEHREVGRMVQDRAFRIWTDSLTRVSNEALSENVSKEDLIFVYAVWPYEMDKWECHEICHRVFEEPNMRIPQWAYNKAEEDVTEGLFDGTMPTTIE